MIKVVNRKFISNFFEKKKMLFFCLEPIIFNIKFMTSHSYNQFVTQKYGKKTYSNIINYQEKTRHLKLLQQDIEIFGQLEEE